MPSSDERRESWLAFSSVEAGIGPSFLVSRYLKVGSGRVSAAYTYLLKVLQGRLRNVGSSNLSPRDVLDKNIPSGLGGLL